MWGRILRILVYNIDVNRKHRILGQTLLDLADVDFFQGKLVSYFFHVLIVRVGDINVGNVYAYVLEPNPTHKPYLILGLWTDKETQIFHQNPGG